MKYPSKGKGDFKIPPAGNHVAICNMIVDLGIQPGRGMYPTPRPEVYVRFELCDELMTFSHNGNPKEMPMTVGGTYTASMSEKANLRKLVEGWQGKFKSDDEAGDFDFKSLLGKKCLLNVIHRESGGKVYANIHSASPLPKGMKHTGTQANPSVYYSLESPDKVSLQFVPEWLRTKIAERITDVDDRLHEAPVDPGVKTGDIDDDKIPF